MKVQALASLLYETYEEWSADRAPLLGAAISYYSVFSIAPLLLIALTVAGAVFGEKAAHGEIRKQLRDTVGSQAARAIEDILAHTQQSPAGPWATLAGIVTVVIGATGVFAATQEALNTVWKVEPKPGRSWWCVLRERFLPFTMVLGTGFLLLLTVLISIVLTAMADLLAPEAIPGGAWLWMLLNSVVSFAFVVGLFALAYKELPDVKLDWADVWGGAAITGLLFIGGKYLLGLYLGHSSVTSAYGAAGSLVLILLWVYYSAQIFLFGAELTRVYTRQRGRRVAPSANAQVVRGGDRSREGAAAR